VTKLLQQAIARLQQLKPEEQDKIALRILDELTDDNNDDKINLDDDEWDIQMKNDWQSGKLSKLIEKAEADIKENKVKEIDEILRNS
jgi:hypothetical protein